MATRPTTIASESSMAPLLLVSVIAVSEVAAALAGGADIVDVKNPAEGALGTPRPGLLREVRALVRPPVELSVALGDAPHLPGLLAMAAAAAAACGADYIKVGLLGSARPEQALELLGAMRQAMAEVRPATRLVAVAYADAGRVGALPPADLPRVAAQAGAQGVMLDTAVKDGLSTFTVLGVPAVAAFVAEARSRGLTAALAGSLGLADLDRASRLGVASIGVRGAACEGGRQGTISEARVRALRVALMGAASDSAQNRRS